MEPHVKKPYKNKILDNALFIISLITLVTIIGICITDDSNAEIGTGTCGNDITWSLDTKTQTLTLSGNGPMYDYRSEYSNDSSLVLSPWVVNDTYGPTCTIKHAIINEGITTIGNAAFEKCTQLEDVILPSTISSIGNCAFNDCNALKTITLPPNLTTIGDFAFHYCFILNSINIPDKVTVIGKSAFYCCDITEIYISPTSQLIEIGDKAFYGCEFNSINIPHSVKTIGSHAFWHSKLTEINVLSPSKLQTIGNSAFEECKFKTINIPDSVVKIGDYAFNDCIDLKTVNIPMTGLLQTIGNYAFYKCPLSSINIPDHVTSIGDYAFYCYHGVSEVNISSNSSLKTIGQYAFNNCLLNTINIPDSVTTIGDYAFNECNNLNTVNISPLCELQTIGNYAFFNCPFNLINLPNYLIKIGDYAFSKCRYLEKITLPSTITTLGTNCFLGCSDLVIKLNENNMTYRMLDGILYDKDYTKIIITSADITSTIHICSSVTTIIDNAFNERKNLKTICIDKENSLTDIGDFAFNRCLTLENIFFDGENKIQTIGESAFRDCTMLKTSPISKNTISVGSDAFSNCKNITTVEFSSKITTLGHHIFSKCSSLNSVTFESNFNLKTIPCKMFEYCTNLHDFTLPDSIETISGSAFENSGLQEIHISAQSNLNYIRDRAFADTDITYFVSPVNLTEISENTFNNCPKLETVDLSKSTKMTNIGNEHTWDPIIDNCNCLKNILFPNSLITIYECIGYCNNLEKLSIPDSVTTINGGFKGCYYLKQIEIPNSSIKISPDSFSVYGPCYVICDPGFIIETNSKESYFHYSYEVHNVRFLDTNGNVLNSQSVHFTDSIVPPTDIPLKDSDQTYDYMFNGWYNEEQQFTSETHAYKDVDFLPKYDEVYIDYSITWNNHDGSIFRQETQHYGDTIYEAPYYPNREPDAEYNYSFSKWNGFTDGMTVTGNMEFTPEFTATLRSYDVTFYDSNGYAIETTTLDYGSKIVLTSQEPYKYPDVQYNYQFAGWDGYTDGMTVTGPHAFYPLYTHTIRNYTVSFYNEGILFHSYSMDYGTEVTLPAEVPLKDSVLEYDYTFSQWYGYYDGITVSGDMSFSAEYQHSLRCYTIKFVSEGITVSELSQEYGSYITVPENPVKDEDRIYSYLFSHWQGLNHTTVIGDETFTAAFKPVYREYTVKFISEGTLFSSKAYHYNDIIPAPAESPVKPSTAEFDYTFTGWVGFSDGFKITSDCSFTANFQSTVRSYDITFMNCGQVFWTGHLEYGTAIEIPAGTPMKGSDERFIYTFSGWEGFVPGMTVSGPHIFDSMFDRTDVLYRISFINNGTIFETRIVAYGTILTLPAKNPTREPNSQYDFEFSHWDGFVEGMTVKENSIFNAAYIENIRSYAVKFISEGKVIQENVLEYGTIIPTPPEPSKQSDDKFDYIFSHWKGLGHSTVIGEETFTAVFDKIYREYTIKFVSDNVNISTIYGHFGDLIYAPADPVRKNTAEFEYRFAGWIDYTDGMHIDGNHTFIAQFIQKIRTCNVSFVSDGLEVYSGDLPYNTEITAPSAPSKASDAEFNYSFKNWNGFTDGMKATEDHVFEAIFDKEIRSYTVKFVSEGEVISKKIMNYGTEIVAPENNPVKPDDDVYRHVFTSWKGYYTGIKVTEDCTFDAIFGNIYREYVVSFISEGQIIEQRMQRYGSEIVVPTEPTKLSTIQFDYTFSGWKGYRENMTVSGNCNFTAEFEEQLRNYHVVFSYEQEVLADSVLPYGTVITLPDNPVIKEEDSAEYMFIGWDGYYDGMTVNGDVTFDALTQKIDITYTVQFRTDDVLVDSRIYHYGDEIVIPNSPEKASTEQYDYIFVGWSGLKNEMTVTEDVTFTAEFIEQLREYTVTFISEGSKYAEYKSPFGSTVKLPKTPVKPSSDVYEYTFTGWNGYYDGMTVNRNCSFTASFEMILESMPYTEPGNNIIIQMAPGCEMNIELEMLNQITESMKQLESEFEIKIENGTISFDKDAFDSIIWDGITLTIECDVSNLSEDDVKAAEGRPVYNIDITGENGNINQFKNGDRQGSIDITVEYNLEDDESSDNLCVWYLEDGELKEKQECIYSEKDGQGYVTFNTTHLSNYVVGHEVNNTDHADSTTMMYISIGVAAVGIICLIASIIIRRR